MAISKTTTHRLTYSRAVISSGRSNIDELISGLQARYGALATLERMNAIRTNVLFYCDLLERLTLDFEAAENELSRELGEDIMARDARTQASEQLTRLLTGCRTRVRENLGESAMRQYRLHETSPHGRESLRLYGAAVLALLERYPRTVTDMFDNTFSTADLVAKLSPAVAAMQTGLDEVAREKRETQLARTARNRTEERFHTSLVNVASILEGHFRMAGLDEQADRVRPTVARTTGELEPGDDEPDDGDPSNNG